MRLSIQHIIYFLMVVTICCSVVLLWAVYDLFTSNDTDFCLKTDKEYLVFADDLVFWTQQHVTLSPPASNFPYTEIDFHTQQGSSDYVIYAYFGQEMVNAPIFFIATSTNWPQTREGSQGYLYVTDESDAESWAATNYEIVKISQNIYCYTEIES